VKTELFGTQFKPNARWVCGRCKANNVTNLAPPLRATEVVHCKRCHGPGKITIELEKAPRAWGGSGA
jgi:hypothetical protein